MKRINLLSLFLLLVIGVSAQTILQENFDNPGMPSGWTVQTNASDGGWNVGTVGELASQYFNIADNGSPRFVATNDDSCNCDKSNDILISPPLDLTGYSNVVADFDVYYTDTPYGGAQENIVVVASTDATNWVLLEDLHGHASWDRHSVDLSAFAGQSTVYVGFQYDDDGGWAYGAAIDNFHAKVPANLEAEMAEVEGLIFGETGVEVPIKGTIGNNGIDDILSIEIQYSVDGGTPVSETFSGLSIPSLGFSGFEFTNGWTPAAVGTYDIEVSIVSVNGAADADATNDQMTFTIEILEGVEVPDNTDLYLAGPTNIIEISAAAPYLDSPTDLDFFPVLGKDELWIVNQRNEGIGGSTLTISEATGDNPTYLERVDGNAWHFMSLPTGIAFSTENFNFATSPGVQDANHSGGTFTGPTLWSSDPDIYAQPSGGNGSHLDMLHGSPFSMGIAHEVDNVFWLYDDWNKDIIRYDFVDDHGPGNDDHSDGILRRYRNLGIEAENLIPNHLVLDKATGWLYFVDNGNDRVMRLDINSGSVGQSLALINEPLAEHSEMTGFTVEEIVNTGLTSPCGIEVFADKLMVSDYANGDIIFYDMNNDFQELGRIETGATGLAGIKMGPDGYIWCVNRPQNSLMRLEPSVNVSTDDLLVDIQLDIFPNPVSDGQVFFRSDVPDLILDVEIFDASGKLVLQTTNVSIGNGLDVSGLASGMYQVKLVVEGRFLTRRLVVE